MDFAGTVDRRCCSRGTNEKTAAEDEWQQTEDYFGVGFQDLEFSTSVSCFHQLHQKVFQQIDADLHAIVAGGSNVVDRRDFTR